MRISNEGEFFSSGGSPKLNYGWRWILKQILIHIKINPPIFLLFGRLCSHNIINGNIQSFSSMLRGRKEEVQNQHIGIVENPFLLLCMLFWQRANEMKILLEHYWQYFRIIIGRLLGLTSLF